MSYMRLAKGYEKDFVLAVVCVTNMQEGHYLYQQSFTLQSIPVNIENLHGKFDRYIESRKAYNDYGNQAMNRFHDLLNTIQSNDFEKN